jgi:hypothetical protein
MSDDPFGKWWPCLKKHHKRTHYWLPQAKSLHAGLNGRGFRYFTLCARPMIDVYMLVKEGVLQFDQADWRIPGVCFCESEIKIYPEIKELLGAEESGFFGKLEDLVLFQDIPETQTLTTLDQLATYVDSEGESISDSVMAKIEDKRRHLRLQKLFPFDFLNLDFCDRYYGNPPDVLRIHETIGRILMWQNPVGILPDGKEVKIDRFVLAITCKVDQSIHSDAIDRLRQIVEDNRDNYDDYRSDLQNLGRHQIAEWSRDNLLDFFMAAWPKEIARLAASLSWDMQLRGHVFYDRISDAGNPYHMVSLIAEFNRAQKCTTYLPVVRQCLNPNSRTQISPFDTETGAGAVLLQDLREIVNLRNQQADHFQREWLPEPLSEIKRLRALGVPV